MISEVHLTNSIEYLDLHNKSQGFKDIILTQSEMGRGRFFDKSLYLPSTASSSISDLEGVSLLIFGGFRGDCNNFRTNESLVFKLSLKIDADDQCEHAFSVVDQQDLWPSVQFLQNSTVHADCSAPILESDSHRIALGLKQDEHYIFKVEEGSHAMQKICSISSVFDLFGHI